MSDESWIWQCDRLIPSETEAGRCVLEEVLQQLKAQHWVPHDIFGVHLAVHEALINAIMHGNHHDAAKHVQVRCRLWPNRVLIEIADEGAGFDPARVPDPTAPERLEAPNGRGVMLMKAFMTQVKYDGRGNRVTLEKTRGM